MVRVCHRQKAPYRGFSSVYLIRTALGTYHGLNGTYRSGEPSRQCQKDCLPTQPCGSAARGHHNINSRHVD